MWCVTTVAYFEDDKGALLTEAAGPLIERLRAKFDVQQIMVRTHWRKGPHLDVIVECEQERFERDIFPECRQAFETWLVRHRSDTVIDEGAYHTLSQKLALSEFEPGPFTPLYENNSVSIGEYAYNEAMKLPELHAIKEDFLAKSCGLIIDLAHRKRADRDGFFFLLATMMASVGQSYDKGGLRRGFLSFRSHAEYFFASHDPKGELRARFDTIDASQGARFDAAVASVGRIDGVPSAPDGDELLRRWIELLIETKRRVEPIARQNSEFLASGDLFVNLATKVAAGIDRNLWQEQRESSEFEKVMQSPAGVALMKSPEFITYRTLINFFYMYLPTLSVPPLQKFCLCYLVANACERAAGMDWRSHMRPQSVDG